MSEWASEAKILQAAEALGEWISTYQQGMTHARAEYPDGMREVIRLASSLELRVKSYLRDASPAPQERR